jgi:hypothetical protein
MGRNSTGPRETPVLIPTPTCFPAAHKYITPIFSSSSTQPLSQVLFFLFSSSILSPSHIALFCPREPARIDPVLARATAGGSGMRGPTRGHEAQPPRGRGARRQSHDPSRRCGRRVQPLGLEAPATLTKRRGRAAGTRGSNLEARPQPGGVIACKM